MAEPNNIPDEPPIQAGYRIYHGLEDVQSVDWRNPVGFLPDGNQQIPILLAMAPGERHVLAVRRVSAAGMEEQSTHVWTLAEIDGQGNLLPGPLQAIQDLSATQTSQDGITLSFTCTVQTPCVAPTAFDVFTDGGTGEINMESPVTTVYYSRPGQTEFEVCLMYPSALTLIAVRPRRDNQLGPVSQISARPGSDPLPPLAL